jgi:hypothetical protein
MIINYEINRYLRFLNQRFGTEVLEHYDVAHPQKFPLSNTLKYYFFLVQNANHQVTTLVHNNP